MYKQNSPNARDPSRCLFSGLLTVTASVSLSLFSLFAWEPTLRLHSVTPALINLPFDSHSSAFEFSLALSWELSLSVQAWAHPHPANLHFPTPTPAWGNLSCRATLEVHKKTINKGSCPFLETIWNHRPTWFYAIWHFVTWRNDNLLVNPLLWDI